MRIAVLSDIHGNLVALEAVLEDVAQRRVEAVIHLGDLVGRGPRPDEVVERIRKDEISGVVGDHDLAVSSPDDGDDTRADPPSAEAELRSRLWTRRRISGQSRNFLKNLPAQIRVQEGDTVFLFTHASPESPDEGLEEATPEARLRSLFDRTGAHVLVVGHTHAALARTVGERLLLNPGSVGNSTEGDPRASYLILDTDRGLVAEHIRVEFDVETVAAESIKFGLPTQLAEAFRLGRRV